ncbi:hypothetical protein KPH14_010701 [Odynerus spinipes]|uniref:TPX2 C-terminal domain-containing protein n=1 Tax=Odynerus spinipes TaxID=1348599 RepID=A0AAD9RVV8_9HYME|nr:hypothetical protein KPH14_010701 [Odynerus spinipes]
MDNYCSPQWVDFTSTPGVPSDDYFEKDHEIDKYESCMEIPEIYISEDNVNTAEISKKRNIYQNLESELNIIKNTPIKVIYSSSSSRSSSKCQIAKKATYDDVLNEAIETFEQCMSSTSDIFKKPMLIKNKASKSLKFHAMDNDQGNVSPSKEIEQIKEDILDQEVKILSPAINECDIIETKNDIDKKSPINSFISNISPNNLLKNDESDLKLDVDNCPVFCTPVDCMKSLRAISHEQRQCKSLEKNSSSRQSKPLRYQCRRQSLKFRRHSNRYISLAAAVLKFQNETPERFRTKSNKDLKAKSVSVKRQFSVISKSVSAKTNLRRSVPVFNLKEEKELKSDIMKELPPEKITSEPKTEESKLIKSRRSYLHSASNKASHSKKFMSTVVNNNGSEIVLKKERILFYDIPIHTAQKKTTHPIPFSFENRDKAKKQSKSEQSQITANKPDTVVKFQNTQGRISCSQKKISASSSGLKNKTQFTMNKKNNHNTKLETNGEACISTETNNTLKNNSHEKRKNNEKSVASTSQNVKGIIKTNKSISMSSLKSCEKIEDKNKKNEHIQNKDAKQLNKKSMSMSSLKSCEKIEDRNKKNEHIQNKDAKQLNEKSRSVSSLKSCEKIEDKNKKNEHIQNKDAKRLNEKSRSVSSLNSHDKSKDRNTEHNTQTKDTNQMKKQSTLSVCKNKSANKKIENLKTKKDPNKIKRVSSTSNNSSTNANIQKKEILKQKQQCIEQQENKQPNVNGSSTSDTNLNQTEHTKLKGITIGMNSYERAKQRHEFDEKMRQKIMMQEEMRQKEEAERLAKEKLQIAMFRKQLEVKARPMPVFKPLLPLRSVKPLTEPQSPAWAHKKKTKQT